MCELLSCLCHIKHVQVAKLKLNQVFKHVIQNILMLNVYEVHYNQNENLCNVKTCLYWSSLIPVQACDQNNYIYNPSQNMRFNALNFLLL